MTKREYIEICKRLWTHISKIATPTYLDKASWPEWKSNGGTIPDMHNDCPCCQYREDDRLNHPNYERKGCHEICPLKGLWVKLDRHINHDYRNSCMDYESPYQAWVRAVTHGRHLSNYANTARVAARKMVRLCDKALKNIDINE